MRSTLTILVILLTAMAAFAETTIYATNEGAGESSLYILKRNTGIGTKVGDTGFDDLMAMDFTDEGRLYAVARRPADEKIVLIEVDPDTGEGEEVGWTRLTSHVYGAAYEQSTGDFYVCIKSEMFGFRLVVLDLETGEPDYGSGRSDGDRGPEAGPLAFGGDGKLYMHSYGILYEINKWNHDHTTAARLGLVPRNTHGSTIYHLTSLDFDPETGVPYSICDWEDLIGYHRFDICQLASIDLSEKNVSPIGVLTYPRYHALAIAPNRAPVIEVGPTATPKRVPLSDPTIRFSVTARDPEGRPLTYHWDFEDGKTGAGNPISHTYASGGAYRVRVTVSDGDRSTSETVLVSVNRPPVVTSGPTVTPLPTPTGKTTTLSVDFHDHDWDDPVVRWTTGDGTELEGARVTHSYEPGIYAATVEIDDGFDPVRFEDIRVVAGDPLHDAKFKAKLNFKKKQKDSMALKCAIDLPAEFDPDGRSLTVDIAGAQTTFVLSAKGKGKSALGKVTLKRNRKSGLWKLTMKTKKRSFANVWADAGVANETVGKMIRMVCIIRVGPHTFLAEDSHFYQGKAGKSGKLR